MRNIACSGCGLVYQTPRPTADAMAAYYASDYRKQYRTVRLALRDGGSACADDPRFEEALAFRAEQQAKTVLHVCALHPGANVLEIGCNHGATLRQLRTWASIEPYGVELDEKQAARANESGVPCSTLSIEEFEPGDRRFHLIQAFHVWEHLHDPLNTLVRIREWLAPNGQVYLEVPNVYAPYGLLEENFFQNAHLTNFSENTLVALCRRAGLEPSSVLSDSGLVVVATKTADKQESLPLPYSPHLLPHPDHNAVWVATRLGHYAVLEKIRYFSEQGPLNATAVALLVRALKTPGFVEHTLDVVGQVVPRLLQQGEPFAAHLIAKTAAENPPAETVRPSLDRFLQAVESVVNPQ